MEMEEFLAHHGVKGMHWGVRHTPSSGTSSSVTPTQEHKGLSRNQKIAIGVSVGIGAVVGGALLAKYSGVKVSDIASLANKARSLKPKTDLVKPKTQVKNHVVDHDTALRRKENVFWDSPDGKRLGAELQNRVNDIVKESNRDYDTEIRKRQQKFWESDAGRRLGRELAISTNDIVKQMNDPNYVWRL